MNHITQYFSRRMTRLLIAALLCSGFTACIRQSEKRTEGEGSADVTEGWHRIQPTATDDDPVTLLVGMDRLIDSTGGTEVDRHGLYKVSQNGKKVEALGLYGLDKAYLSADEKYVYWVARDTSSPRNLDIFPWHNLFKYEIKSGFVKKLLGTFPGVTLLNDRLVINPSDTLLQIGWWYFRSDLEATCFKISGGFVYQSESKPGVSVFPSWGRSARILSKNKIFIVDEPKPVDKLLSQAMIHVGEHDELFGPAKLLFWNPISNEKTTINNYPPCFSGDASIGYGPPTYSINSSDRILGVCTEKNNSINQYRIFMFDDNFRSIDSVNFLLPDGDFPFEFQLSPSGKHLYFASDTGGIYRIPTQQFFSKKTYTSSQELIQASKSVLPFSSNPEEGLSDKVYFFTLTLPVAKP